MNDKDLFDEENIDKQTDEEYKVLVAMFRDLLVRFDNQTIDLEELQDIIESRALFAFGHCIRRFGIDFNDALDIVRNHNDIYLTPLEKDRKKCLLAALDNLIDFAIAEETTMYADLENQIESDDPEEIFFLYNQIYAKTENRDIDYASLIAAFWINLSEETTLMFTTQGDERVRDSHMALEGLSYPKSQFPEWLIPPIDWRCRCYLSESFTRPNYSEYSNLDEKLNKAVNPIFQNSLAVGGPIFSDQHPYFLVDESLIESMKKISSSIKLKYNIA